MNNAPNAGLVKGSAGCWPGLGWLGPVVMWLQAPGPAIPSGVGWTTRYLACIHCLSNSEKVS